MFRRYDWVEIARDSRAEKGGAPFTNPLGLRGTVVRYDKPAPDGTPWVRCYWPSYLGEFSLPEADLAHVVEPRATVFAVTRSGRFAEIDCYTHSPSPPAAQAPFLKEAARRWGLDTRYWVAVPVGMCVVYQEVK